MSRSKDNRDFPEKIQDLKEEVLRIITETIQDVVWMSTPGLERTVYVSPSYETVWGRTCESLYERPASFLEGVHPDDRERVGAGLKALEQGKSEFEFRILQPDESVRWVQERVFPVCDEHGKVEFMIGIATDITRRKKTELQMASYLEELERSNKELEEFAYIASHDLQEPLRKIQTFGTRLSSKYGEVLDERGRDYIERMNNAATRMRRLIEGLLAYSRINTRPGKPKRISLPETIEMALGNLEGLVRETGGTVQIGEIAVPLEADPGQMLQLFQNLIGNGLKFHRKNVSPVVKIGARLLDPQRRHTRGRPPSPNTCMISVEDNGIGFENKYLDRIFEPFQRLQGRNEYEGTGMGLAICQKIVERHGGAIWAKSNPGEGSIFTVILPLKQNRNRENAAGR